MTTYCNWILSLLLATLFVAQPIISFTPSRIRPHPSSAARTTSHDESLATIQRRRSPKLFSNKSNQDNDEEKQHSAASSSHQRQPKNNPNENNDNNISSGSTRPIPPEEDLKEQKKKQIGMATRSLVKNDNNEEDNDKDNAGLFDKLNPFQAGKNLRKSLDSAISAISRASSGSGVSFQEEGQKRSVYYLDDRFQESGGALFTQESNPYLSRLAKEDYIPEVLVVGATGEVGRLVVRRLLLEGNCRCRCLVSDLYSRTLNMLGTGVVYCQGDLSNLGSLEYALTDVDKIVICAGAPRPDEESLQTKDERSFREKFLGFAKDNLDDQNSTALGKIEASPPASKDSSDVAWDRMESVLKVRAQLAEQVDFVGMQNLVRAYQNVRHADYGTSQAAKRSLFKFRSRAEDFNLFDIDDSMDVTTAATNKGDNKSPASTAKKEPSSFTTKEATTQNNGYPYESTEYEDLYDEYQYEEEYDKYAESFQLGDDAIEERQDASVKTQVKWIRNEFGQGVFVGKVPTSTDSGGVGGEASIVSSRLRTRDGGPEDGIDLSGSGGFGGFVCRVCADGGVYEAFVRDASYETNGIEYVCEFSTGSKQPRRGNASRNKFVSVRLPFESFKPIRRRKVTDDTTQETTMPTFQGKDVRYIGFRFRSSRNRSLSRSKKQKEGGMTSFYIALSYIKLFRRQPEPEIVYLSDARIPRVVLDAQVKHDIREIVPVESLSSSGLTGVQMFESTFQELSSEQVAANRIPEETYYKYLGEQILKNSGLSYAIVRISDFNESPSSEASTIELKSTNDDIKPVSRAEAAQVCVSALLDPNALNKSFYVTKKDGSSSNNKLIDESMTTKFMSLSTDPVKP